MKVEMVDLMNSQRVKDVHRLEKNIVEKGQEVRNEPGKNQPGKNKGGGNGN